MFPVKYNIYLHDRPAKVPFTRAKRDFSHGCIRLAQPFEFANEGLFWEVFLPRLKTGREITVRRRAAAGASHPSHSLCRGGRRNPVPP